MRTVNDWKSMLAVECVVFNCMRMYVSAAHKIRTEQLINQTLRCNQSKRETFEWRNPFCLFLHCKQITAILIDFENNENNNKSFFYEIGVHNSSNFRYRINLFANFFFILSSRTRFTISINTRVYLSLKHLNRMFRKSVKNLHTSPYTLYIYTQYTHLCMYIKLHYIVHT